MVFGLKEECTPQWTEREKKEKRCVEKLVETLQEEKELTGEIEEIKRLGRYVKGGQRPMKIRFRSQVAAEETLSKSWKLAKVEEYKQVWIKRDRTREERDTINELRKEANE